MKHINMLYTVDKKYFPIMLVSIYSLLEHNPNIEFDIHIIAEGLTPEDLSLLEQTIHCFKNARHQLYDFEPIKKLIEKYNMPRWRNSAMANARLFFDSYIDASENLLYVDSDTIIRKSLEGLFDYTGAVNMVRDPMVPRKHWKSLDPDMMDDEDIDKLLATPLSRTSHYKLAGNSIVVDTLAAIFKNLFSPEEAIPNSLF